MSAPGVLRPGLCSVTFRGRPVGEVIANAVTAGVHGIEWGGDVHLPPGDISRAREIARACVESGIAAPSYGSYLRVGADQEGSEIDAVLDTAQALGADNVRVWAGQTGSDQANAALRARVGERLVLAADAAARRGIALSIEFHRNTLTDVAPSAASLLESAGHDNLFSYWQPVPERGLPAWKDELALLRPWLSHLHVFHWRAGNERRPLAEGEESWREVLKAFHPTPRFAKPVYAFLEFVQDDRPDQFHADMAVLLRLCRASGIPQAEP